MIMLLLVVQTMVPNSFLSVCKLPIMVAMENWHLLIKQLYRSYIYYSMSVSLYCFHLSFGSHLLSKSLTGD